MSVLCCCWHRSHQFSPVHLKLGSVVVGVRDVHPHNRLPLPGRRAALPLDVEGVEEERHLLRGLVGGGLVERICISVVQEEVLTALKMHALPML